MPTPDVITQPSARHLAEQTNSAELAAWHLYQSVRPEGGLWWHELTHDQQARYHDLITEARAETDLSKGWPQDDARERWADDQQTRHQTRGQ